MLVYCRGGLRQAGTIAVRLLIELGMKPAIAIAKVREVRPAAIETQEQANYVLDLGMRLTNDERLVESHQGPLTLDT